MIKLMASTFAVLLSFSLTVQAEAKYRKHHYYHRYHLVRSNTPSAPQQAWEYREALSRGTAPQVQITHGRRSYRVERSDVTYIPNPPGTWRVAISCAHRLAAYWGLGKGLDKVSTWPRVFARASGPGVGIAAVRYDQHHVLGIIGGGPGNWRVVDFNSGNHLNREYTMANFSGYFFVDPRSRMASR